jgi:hypothetical protein
MIDRNGMSQASTASGTLKDGNNVPAATNDSFTTVKKPKAKKANL